MPATAAAQEQPATRFAKDQLKAVVERVERLEEEKKAIADDIKDVYAEAKAHGFDVKALRAIVRLRKQDTDERKEQDAILETYMLALGMVRALNAVVVTNTTAWPLKRFAIRPGLGSAEKAMVTRDAGLCMKVLKPR